VDTWVIGWIGRPGRRRNCSGVRAGWLVPAQSLGVRPITALVPAAYGPLLVAATGFIYSIWLISAGC